MVPCLRVHGVHDAVGGCVRLSAPPLREGAEVSRVVADLVKELNDDLLRFVVVARDRKGAAVPAPVMRGSAARCWKKMLLKPLTTLDSGRWAASRAELVVDSLSSSAMLPSRCGW